MELYTYAILFVSSKCAQSWSHKYDSFYDGMQLCTSNLMVQWVI